MWTSFTHQSQPSESVTQRSVITWTSQHHWLTLTPYSRLTVNSQLHQNYSIELEAAISHVVNMRMRAPTPPYLWASISTVTMWFCRRWPLFLQIGQGAAGRQAVPLQTAKPAQQPRPLTGYAEAISRCVGVKPRTLREPPFP
ncbi:hypothetical protein Celaphus_00005918 [Cervus elaphus hippelaphus]|uniref:Uncharacterized protein n=1 Tax=Cervus elaphus hippelaphus TaxID=46360 RepID=A0A212CUH8_CEREH|nr:hypothetical protein Celaphus_00005918 [Cervus elaphus hippelaphus]